MDKTEFIKLYEYEYNEFDPDDIIEQQRVKKDKPESEGNNLGNSNEDLLDELGI